MNEELYGLMVHATELQEHAKMSQDSLDSQISKFSKAVYAMPSTVQQIALDNIKEQTKDAENILKQTTEKTQAILRGLWLYPAIVTLSILLLGGGFWFFGYQWLVDERKQLKEEIRALNYELATTAQITQIQGTAGYWVKIDKSKSIVTSTEGDIYARLPIR